MPMDLAFVPTRDEIYVAIAASNTNIRMQAAHFTTFAAACPGSWYICRISFLRSSQVSMAFSFAKLAING